jgi:hypothetical protein
MTVALLVLAQHSQSAPDSGVGAGLIVGIVVFILLAIGTLVFFVTRRSKASRGGVEHPTSDKRRGEPPFESIERHGS